jgi:hypothetical protein
LIDLLISCINIIPSGFLEEGKGGNICKRELTKISVKQKSYPFEAALLFKLN